MASWPEIDQVEEEKRRELVLKGNKDLKQRVVENEGCLPSQLFNLSLLNFLEVNGVGLSKLSEDIGKLNNLTQLFLQHNELTIVPDGICKIQTLKILDLCDNSIETLPDDIGNLTSLHTLNVASNALTCFPSSFSNLSHLAVLHISQNKFSEFPQVLYENSVSGRLAELYASHNEIGDIHDDIEKIVLLKVLDMSNNQLKELTQAIGNCLKLKQVNFKSNPLKDKRLKKLIDQDSLQKSILDYIRSKGRKKLLQSNTGNEHKSNSKGSRKKLKDQKIIAANEEEAKDLVKYTIQVLRLESETIKDDRFPFRVIVYDDVREYRQFIVGCVIRYLDLERGDLFKNFISLQTRVHDEICQKRTVATIATHDLKAIPSSVVYYDAIDPTAFKIRPLGRKAELTGMELYQRLCKEADSVRKEKKRNQVSGIYKYLSLLKGKDKFAYLRRSSDDCVISLPPLTNCDATKISAGTTDIFVEVTGAKSLNTCKAVMDDLLSKMVEFGFYSHPPKEHDFYDDSSDEETDQDDEKCLVVQQVRVEGEEGNIRVVYPSRTDLVFDTKDIKILRSKQ